MEKKDKLEFHALLSVSIGALLIAQSIKNFSIENLHIMLLIGNIIMLWVGLYFVVLSGALIERQKNELKKINIEIKEK